jgi:hypothetical protein
LNLGINLPFRETEWNSPTGKAAVAESDFVRARYKSLVERTQQAGILEEETPGIFSYPKLTIPLGGYAVVTGDAWDEAEIFVDAEPADPTSSSIKSSPSQRGYNKPEHLAFRYGMLHPKIDLEYLLIKLAESGTHPPGLDLRTQGSLPNCFQTGTARFLTLYQ